MVVVTDHQTSKEIPEGMHRFCGMHPTYFLRSDGKEKTQVTVINHKYQSLGGHLCVTYGEWT